MSRDRDESTLAIAERVVAEARALGSITESFERRARVAERRASEAERRAQAAEAKAARAEAAVERMAVLLERFGDAVVRREVASEALREGFHGFLDGYHRCWQGATGSWRHHATLYLPHDGSNAKYKADGSGVELEGLRDALAEVGRLGEAIRAADVPAGGGGEGGGGEAEPDQAPSP